jgi:hypothetical protein
LLNFEPANIIPFFFWTRPIEKKGKLNVQFPFFLICMKKMVLCRRNTHEIISTATENDFVGIPFGS